MRGVDARKTKTIAGRRRCGRVGRVRGLVGGIGGGGRGDRQKSSDRPDCFSSGELRARSPAAGREKPKPAGWPLSRALPMGDDRRCSCSSSATVAMRCSSRPGKTRGFVETLVGSASVGAGKRPGTRPGRRSTRPPPSSAERRGCASEMSLSLREIPGRPPATAWPIALIRVATLAAGGPFRRLGRPAASMVKNPTGKCWPLRANTGRSSSTCRTAHIDGSPTERTRHQDSAGFR